MRLLRHLLPKARQSGKPRARYALAPAALAPVQLDYDPMVAELANRCR